MLITLLVAVANDWRCAGDRKLENVRRCTKDEEQKRGKKDKGKNTTHYLFVRSLIVITLLNEIIQLNTNYCKNSMKDEEMQKKNYSQNTQKNWKNAKNFRNFPADVFLRQFIPTFS